MKKLVFLLLLLASPMSAQPTQASFDSLKAQVDSLKRIIGSGWWQPQLPCATLNANRPEELPNGDYNLAFRNRQFGCASVLWESYQAQISGLAARTASVEAAVAGGYQVGTAVFDKIRANKICVGDMDCDPDWNAQFQIRSSYSSIIGLEANLAKVDPQDPTHTHVSQFGVSQDGGTRIQQNAQLTFSRGFIGHVNPCREWLNLGPDSRSSLSIYKGTVDEATCTPISHDRSQDLVFLTDENTKEIKLFIPRPLWNLRILGSSTLNAGDLTLQPKQ